MKPVTCNTWLHAMNAFCRWLHEQGELNERVKLAPQRLESRNVITILIAHRLSTIMHAHCIFVLERGRVVESDTHGDLLEQKGLYYAMWRQQIGERRTALASAVVAQLSGVH